MSSDRYRESGDHDPEGYASEPNSWSFRTKYLGLDSMSPDSSPVDLTHSRVRISLYCLTAIHRSPSFEAFEIKHCMPSNTSLCPCHSQTCSLPDLPKFSPSFTILNTPYSLLHLCSAPAASPSLPALLFFYTPLLSPSVPALSFRPGTLFPSSLSIPPPSHIRLHILSSRIRPQIPLSTCLTIYNIPTNNPGLLSKWPLVLLSLSVTYNMFLYHLYLATFSAIVFKCAAYLCHLLLS